MSYEIKYHKYKHKYLELKRNIKDGGRRSSKTITAFKNTTKFYILANLDNQYIKHRLEERRRVLLKGKLPKQQVLHITLLQFEVNQDNPDSLILFNSKFYKEIDKFYKNTFKKEKVTLLPVPMEYDMLGPNKETQFFVKKYKPNKTMTITHFRTLFYKYLEKKLGKPTRKMIKRGSQKYMQLSYNKKPLMAIPDYYFGKGKWLPHISILNMSDLKLHHRALYNKVVKERTVNQKLDYFYDVLDEHPLKPIGPVKMATDIKHLTIALRNPAKKIYTEHIVL